MKQYKELQESIRKVLLGEKAGDQTPPASPSAEENPKVESEAPVVSTDDVNKPSAEEPTAFHGAAKKGEEGDVTPPTQGSSNTEGFKLEINAKVSHPAFGEGNVLATMGEGVEAVAEVMFKESLKRVSVWELTAPTAEE
jgi:hypothetical protein